MVDFDVVIIGGGIQGAGVAQSAAADGYRVALLEASGIGGATSSKSSKLVHGGLRYLESAQFGLVRQSLKERQQLLRLAPGLVKLLPFYIPVYRHTSRRPWKIRLGLFLYTLLGGMSADTRYKKLNEPEQAVLAGLDKKQLQCVYRYFDAQTDDRKLTRAVMESALSLGVELLCPARFVRAQCNHDAVDVYYQQGHNRHALKTRVLVNAAGPWVNNVLQLVEPQPDSLEVDLVQGAHIILDAPPPDGIYYVEAPIDKRAVFIMPWYGNTMVGTTETLFTGGPQQVVPLPEEIDYLQQVYRNYFPGNPFRLLSSFAGLRVLPVDESSLFHRQRDTIIHVAASCPRVLSLYGGKLTSYRATSRKVIERLRAFLPAYEPKADVDSLVLSGD